MGKFIDLTGQRFGKLKVIELDKRKDAYVRWICKCDCGRDKIIRSDALRSGAANSCGCLQRGKATKSKMFLKYEKVLYSVPDKIEEYKKTGKYEIKEEIKHIQDSINKLNNQHQQFIILRYFEYRQHKEIMGILGLNSVKSNLLRTKALIEFIGYYENLI